MTWAIHGFHSEALMLDLEHVDVVLVVLVVTTGLPQFEVVHIGSDYLRVAPHSILFSDHFSQAVVDLSSVGVPENTTRGQVVMVEELLMLTNDTVITLRCFFNKGDMLIKFFL